MILSEEFHKFKAVITVFFLNANPQKQKDNGGQELKYNLLSP